MKIQDREPFTCKTAILSVNGGPFFINRFLKVQIYIVCKKRRKDAKMGEIGNPEFLENFCAYIAVKCGSKKNHKQQKCTDMPFL